MPTPRPRKPYTRSSDSSDSDFSEPLDEEHQESLIQSLQHQDTQKSTFYLQSFLGIILLSGLPFVFTLLSFSSATGMRDRMLAVLCASSLACSGYILYFLPLEPSTSPASGSSTIRRMRVLEKSPVEKFLPVLNGALAGVLAVAGWVSSQTGSGKGSEEMLTLGLPAIIFIMTIVVRKQLSPVDFEDLQRARYELKGV